MKPVWYKSWFDSPYYHVLYNDRDEVEAQAFIDNLLAWLQPSPEARILDVACGKGRHSVYLAAKGLEVVGLDLSVQNITHAQQFEHERLSFFVHDMRMPFRINYFDFSFNFFTSFGYFEQDKPHIDTLKSLAKALRPTGKLVLDYFNASYTVSQLVAKEKKVAGGIAFKIKRRVESGRIIKEIAFVDQGINYQFEERVKAFSLESFEFMFQQAGLQIEHTFGNYGLNPFDEKTSERLILVASRL